MVHAFVKCCIIKQTNNPNRKSIYEKNETKSITKKNSRSNIKYITSDTKHKLIQVSTDGQDVKLCFF